MSFTRHYLYLALLEKIYAYEAMNTERIMCYGENG